MDVAPLRLVKIISMQRDYCILKVSWWFAFNCALCWPTKCTDKAFVGVWKGLFC